MNQLEGPKPIPEAVKRDLDGVLATVIRAGGLVANKPQENKERRGQVLELENEDLDIGRNISKKPIMCTSKVNLLHVKKICAPYGRQCNACLLVYLSKASDINTHGIILLIGELGPLIERPDENLLPPPSNVPVPDDFNFDASLPEFVKEQRIEFLQVQRPLDSSQAWSFPGEENMRRVWNFVRNKLDSDYILDVCLWCRVEKNTDITSLMLSTVNLPIMEQVRHEIRLYREIEGVKFETYNKTLFIKRYGISMYVPKEQAGLSPAVFLSYSTRAHLYTI